MTAPAPPPVRRVFISFMVEDLNYATLMAAWSANDNDDFAMYDERLKVAIDSTNAEYIKTKLRPKIERASALVCLIGKLTSGSRWVKWEVEHARKNNKGLVAVELETGVPRPRALTGVGAIFVPYEKAKIQRAIEWAATAGKKDQDWIFKDK